jgi:hypothetical protein
VPADQRARGDDQPKTRKVVVAQQPGRQRKPGAIRPGRLAVQLAWGSAALGDGQLVAQHEDLDVLGRGILAR